MHLEKFQVDKIQNGRLSAIIHLDRPDIYPDDIARLWNSDGHVLAKWYYCDHQSTLAEYSLIPLSVLSLGGVSVCFTRPAVEKWRSLRPGSTQCE